MDLNPYSPPLTAQCLTEEHQDDLRGIFRARCWMLFDYTIGYPFLGFMFLVALVTTVVMWPLFYVVFLTQSAWCWLRGRGAVDELPPHSVMCCMTVVWCLTVLLLWFFNSGEV